MTRHVPPACLTGGKPAAPLRPHVVILGGGLAGASVAWSLAEGFAPGTGPRITLIEPRAVLGAGLAYSTPDPAHRLNVPHMRMSLDPADPQHYSRWLAANGHAAELSSVYTARATFGAYVRDHLAPLLERGRIRHLRGRAVAAQSLSGSWRILLEDGTRIDADQLVLAASHPAPGLPAGTEALRGHPALIPDAYAPAALDPIAPEAAVLVLGAGLTGADVVASLTRRGHRGPIRMVSRHGRRSQPHGPDQGESGADFLQAPATTARALLRRIRAELARDAAAGLTWHAVFDRLRKQGQGVWAHLDWAERARLVRHLRGLWDMHRFRIAPQTEACLAAAESTGQLQRLAARVAMIRAEGTARAEITLRLRHGGRQTFHADHVVLATGPAHRDVTCCNPLYADLARQGRITPDRLGLGLAATPQGRALDATGRAADDLFIAGPLARAAVGELMGAPEVIAWSRGIAQQLARALTA